jgi:queuine tRNA-ribosyltransferase
MEFNLIAKDKNSKARAAVLTTDHGAIETPIFMPVGTVASVKGVHQRELRDDINPDIILGNTYHLYLRPKLPVLEQAGGLHKFMNWDRNILTDSGGYQVYSLSGTRKIKEEGVKFKSHIDGSYHTFTPENVMDIQRTIGADIIMAFDECTPYPCDYNYAKRSMHMTHRWLERCITQFNNTKPKYGYEQTLFPIVQGSTYKDLRVQSAEYIANTNCFGNAIGGLSVGEPAEEMYAMTEVVCNVLPKGKPRYLMGVGTPINILENIALGIDMFDCVMPTRSGRTGLAFTWEGKINLKNSQYQNDKAPLDENCTIRDLNKYSKSYLNHLIRSNEMMASMLISLHNINFYQQFMREIRKNIEEGTFKSFYKKYIKLFN